jgi:hypothetical protein
MAADKLTESVIVTGAMPFDQLLVGGVLRTQPVDRVPPWGASSGSDSRAATGTKRRSTAERDLRDADSISRPVARQARQPQQPISSRKRAT